MKYDLSDYYYHNISKDDSDKIYIVFENIINDKKIKSQKLLGRDENKFNGNDYISLASFSKDLEYNSFIIEEKYFNGSKLSSLFSTYEDYLEYMKLDNKLEEKVSMEDYFINNNTTNKRDYYNYLDSISRTYPVDMKNLYDITNDEVYKMIIELSKSDIVNCYKSGNCFNEYIKKSKGITFIFPKNIDVLNVNIIPNLPSDLESLLVEKLKDGNERYSNQIGEVQVKDYIDITNAIGLILADNIDVNYIKEIINKNDLEYILFRLENDELVEINI